MNEIINQSGILGLLINGGLASVALVSLYFNFKIITNHLAHSNEALNRLENAILKLTQFLEDKLK